MSTDSRSYIFRYEAQIEMGENCCNRQFHEIAQAKVWLQKKVKQWKCANRIVIFDHEINNTVMDDNLWT